MALRSLNAVPQLTLMGREHCDLVHQASLEILRRTGVRVYQSEARARLAHAGAQVSDETLVRLPAELVEWALGRAPSRLVLCRRGSNLPQVRLEGREVSFGTGSDCPNYLDPRSGERRTAGRQDVVDAIRLVDALPELDFCMSMGIPADLGGASPYREQFALMLANTTKPNVFVCDGRADCESIVAMAAAAAGGTESLRLNPTLLLYSEPSSPLRHTESATEKLIFMAEQGLPVVHSPAPMMGGTAPVSLAGAMALGNAEVLSSLVIHQLTRSGAPFVYGVQAHHMDMKAMISVYGAPEYELARVMSVEMARYYGLPSWGNAGMTDSPTVDEQAAMDAITSVMVAMLTGTNLVHDVGYAEAGLATSPEMIVLSAEAISMMRRFAAGVDFDAESLALEVIHQVGPGGDYLSQEHTLRHFREFWSPRLLERQRFDRWTKAGGKRLGQRLRERTLAIMDEHQPEPLPHGVASEIEYILRSG